jgi:dihydroxy-acid dehydratase
VKVVSVFVRFSCAASQDETQHNDVVQELALLNDLKKAQVGIVSMGYRVIHVIYINDLAKILKRSLEEDLVGLIFNTIGVSDGMSNGTEGMRFL